MIAMGCSYCNLFSGEPVAEYIFRHPGITFNRSAARRAINGGPSWVYPDGNAIPIKRIWLNEGGIVHFDLEQPTTRVSL